MIVLGLLLTAMAVVAAGVIYKIQRDKEVITLETDEPGIEIVKKRNGELIRIIDTKSNKAWELDAHKLRRNQDGTELEVELPGTEPLVIRRNGDVAVTIRRKTKGSEKPIPAAVAVSKPEEVYRIPYEYGGWESFSPDGKRLVLVGTENRKPVAVVFETTTGKRLGALPLPQAPARTFFIGNTDGLLVQTMAGVNRWNLTTGKKVQDLAKWPDESWLGAVVKQVSADGKRFIVYFWAPTRVVDDSYADVYDTTTGNELFNVTPSDPTLTVCHEPRFSPDCKQLVTGETGLGRGLIRFWNSETGKPIRSIAGDGDLNPLIDFLEDGLAVSTQFLTRTNKTVVGTWNAETSEFVRQTSIKFE